MRGGGRVEQRQRLGEPLARFQQAGARGDHPGMVGGGAGGAVEQGSGGIEVARRGLGLAPGRD